MPGRPSPALTFVLTSAALVGFAANSLLCRMALRPLRVDAASFTSIRLASGAIVLALLSFAARTPPAARRSGSWLSAAALFGYAAAFSFAYLKLGAGVGALILFGVVQATMIAWGMVRGERPTASEWVGLAVALGGLVALTFPGLRAPDPLGAGLMAAAGLAWGIYSLRGKGSPDALAATADNFLRSVPFAAGVSLATIPHFHIGAKGALLAAASGAIASGVGYTLWYSALRGLTSTRAAIVQLAVPVLAASGGLLFLHEAVTLRLGIAAAAILGGVAAAVMGKKR